MNWRQNPSRVAWLIVMISFTLCVLLVIAIPVGARAALLHSTRTKFAFLEATQGTAQLWSPNSADAAAIIERRPVPEGSRIVTDSAAKGVLSLSVDEEGQRILSTIQLSPATEMVLREARSPRFNLSADPHRAELDLTQGRLFLTVTQADERDVLIRLSTPHSDIHLGVGVYDIAAVEGETRVRVRSGVAQVIGAGREIELGAGQRVNVAAGQQPQLPTADTVNLIVDGSFGGQLAPLWQEFAEVKPGQRPGSVELVQDDRRNAVRFTRRTEEDVPNRVGIVQAVNRDVEKYDSLSLRLALKILYQSVPGGGEMASEYPVMVDLFYTDIYGKDLHWYAGFYYLDLPPGSPYPEPDAERVPLGVWYTYESPNLFELLEQTRPAFINSVTIYANGHDYDSLVTDVALTVQ